MLKNKNGWWMHHHELYPLLGIKGSKLPVEGFGEIEVQGVHFRCAPQEPTTKRNWRGNLVHRSKHRLFYFCEPCGGWIPFGRAGQHNRGKDHKFFASWHD